MRQWQKKAEPRNTAVVKKSTRETHKGFFSQWLNKRKNAMIRWLRSRGGKLWQRWTRTQSAIPDEPKTSGEKKKTKK